MLLHLFTREGSSTALRNTVSICCRDFLSVGHLNLIPFVERCAAGNSMLSCGDSPEERRRLIVAGLTAVQKSAVYDLMTTGLILRIS